VDQAAWLEQFDQRVTAFVAAERERIDERLRQRREAERGEIKVVADVVILGSSCDDGDLVAASSVVRRVVASALAAGWSARTVRALAADPTKGLIESVTVRFARHDERGFAAWWGGRFQCAWLLGPLGFERLGMRTTLKIRSVADALNGLRLTRQQQGS